MQAFAVSVPTDSGSRKRAPVPGTMQQSVGVQQGGEDALRCCLTLNVPLTWVDRHPETSSSQTELKGRLRIRQDHYGSHPRSVLFEEEDTLGAFRVLNLHQTLGNIVWSAVGDPTLQGGPAPFELRATATPLSAYNGGNRCVCLKTFQIWVRQGAWERHRRLYGASPCETAICRAVAANVHSVHIDPKPATASEHVMAGAYAQRVRLPLMDHQVRGVRWMLGTERRLRERSLVLSSDPTVQLPVISQRVHLDARRFVDVPNAERVDALSIHPQGYVLAEPPGRGKTAMVLELVACDGPYTPPDGLLSTGATLVIVPNHLSKQWVAEAAKFAPHLRTVRLLDLRDARNVTYGDLQSADLVVTSFSYMTSLRYAKLHRAASGGTVDAMRVQAAMRAQSHPEEVRLASDPLLEVLRWRRVVVDEVHDVVQEHVPATRQNPLHTVVADVWLCVSGTPPMQTPGRLSQLAPMLLPCRTLPSAWLQSLWTPGFCSQVVSNVVLRSEESSSASRVRHSVHAVSVTPSEQSVLSARSRMDLATQVQVASYFGAAEAVGSDLDEMATMKPLETIMEDVKGDFCRQIEETKRGIAEKRRSVETMQREIEALAGQEAEAAQQDAAVLIRVKRSCVTRLGQAIEQECATLTGLERSARYFEESARCQDTEARECPICYDATTDTILRCGHTYCRQCIVEALRNKPECPVCKTVTVARHVHCIEARSDAMDTDKGGDDEAEVRRFGSKLAQILRLLRQVTAGGEQAVVFVQWNSLMKAFCAVMREAGLSFAAASGNSHQRAAAVQRFDAGKASVLVLTSESCAGLNLTAASHVVWGHAPVGEFASTRAMVDQSVARCDRMGQTRPVTVHWFITEATAEHTEFEKFWERFEPLSVQ